MSYLSVLVNPGTEFRNAIQPVLDNVEGLRITPHSPTSNARIFHCSTSDLNTTLFAVYPPGLVGVNTQISAANANDAACIISGAIGTNVPPLIVGSMDAFGNQSSYVEFQDQTAQIFFFRQSTDVPANNHLVGSISPGWAIGLDATWAGKLDFQVADHTSGAPGRLCLSLKALGGAPAIGFLGATAVNRPAATDDLRQSLINLGLYTTGGATPLDLNDGILLANMAITSKSANYTLLYTDYYVLADASSGALTLTLPTAVGHTGREFGAKKTDLTANAVHISTTGGQTIDGAAAPYDIVSPKAAVKLVSDGSAWQLV